MMSLYFAVAARRPFIAMKECLPNGYFSCFVDDNSSRGPTAEVQNSIRAMQVIGPTAGIYFNPEKSAIMIGRKASLDEAHAVADAYTQILGAEPTIVFHPDNYGDAVEQARAAERYGKVHLGVPIGSPQYIRAWLAKRIEVLR